MTRRVLINLVFFVAVFLVLLVWAAGNIITVDAIEDPYKITGRFAATVGVQQDSEVTYLGVNAGRVDSVKRIPGAVEITMKIDKDRKIPEGSIARIFRKSAVGEPYIDFVPPDDYQGDDHPVLEPGDEIPIEDTTVPLEFSELLRSASALIGSIDPDAAGSLVHELAVGLDGRGADLREITMSFDELTQTFADRTELLDRLTENSAIVTHAVAERRGSLQAAIENISAVADTLERARGNVQILLTEGTQLIGTTADLVSEQKQNLDCLFHDLESLVRLTGRDEKVAGLETLLTNGPTGFGLVYSTMVQESDGPWVQVHLLVNPENPPAQYVPRRSLPQVPTIPACQSSLAPASTQPFDLPAQASAAVAAGRTEPLPATGGSEVAALGLLVLGGALVAWWARRLSERPG